MAIPTKYRTCPDCGSQSALNSDFCETHRDIKIDEIMVEFAKADVRELSEWFRRTFATLAKYNTEELESRR